MRRLTGRRTNWMVAVVCAMLACSSASAAATVPAGFTDALVAAIPGGPTAIAPAPGGRLLVTTQGGQLWVLRNGVRAASPALDLAGRICANSERGLLGVAADPQPATGPLRVYLYYTARRTDPACPTGTGGGVPVNRVSRFVLGTDDRVAASSEAVLLDGIPSPAGNHNAGDVEVGKDGLLYVSVGDGGCDYRGDSGCAGANDAARDRSTPNGKILRITREGGVPLDNPFTGVGTARCNRGPVAAGVTCQETFATGLRNPFRFAFDPDATGTAFRINDVGQNVWEEVDQGLKGADYGWNRREGHCAQTGSQDNCGGPKPASLTDPIVDYGHRTGCGSITGGAYVPRDVWPAAFNGAYLYGDYVCGRIFARSSGGGVSTFASALPAGGPIDLRFAPHAGGRALFYTTYAGGGQLRRIAVSQGNRAPTAALRATPGSGPAPLTVRLDGAGSSDPDGDALTYLWAFGDGTPGTSTTTPAVTHRYEQGRWTATLRVRDAAGTTSAPVQVTIQSGNRAPSVAITAPGATDRFTVGAVYALRGTATDPEDGPLPDSALSWIVIRHHATHTHPYLGPVAGNGVRLVGPNPEDLAATTNSFLEIRLTATDSQGLSSTVSRNFLPLTVPVTFQTSPSGRRVTVNGAPITAPATLTSWAGFRLQVGVPLQTDARGRLLGFASWSDGGASTHTFVTPRAATTLTARLSLRGLQATYFDDPNLTGAQVHRLDPRIDFDFGTGAPAAGIGPDTFSARWTGQVVARFSETYRFTTTADDGARVWIDGRLAIDGWTGSGPATHSGTATLTAGVPAAIAVEYREQSGNAAVRLSWSSPSQPSQVVPVDRLRPAYAVNFQPTGRPVPPGYRPDVGLPFGRRAGFGSGWNRTNSGGVRDRNAARSPDQRYDTLAFMPPGVSWELALSPGRYRVHAVSGDPVFTGAQYDVQAEGVALVRGTSTAARRWIEGRADVTVSDGRLTLTSGPTARSNAIDFLEVELAP